MSYEWICLHGLEKIFSVVLGFAADVRARRRLSRVVLQTAALVVVVAGAGRVGVAVYPDAFVHAVVARSAVRQIPGI